MSKVIHIKLKPGARVDFPHANITVTLTGEEWVALLGRTVRRELSLYGAQVYNRATGKLGEQLTAAQRALNGDAS